MVEVLNAASQAHRQVRQVVRIQFITPVDKLGKQSRYGLLQVRHTEKSGKWQMVKTVCKLRVVEWVALIRFLFSMYHY